MGTGAVGGYYSAQLARSGARVSTVHRSDFQTVKEKGIHINGLHGPYHFIPEQVLQRAGDFDGQADIILVGLKSLPEIDVAALIREAVRPHTVILLLQNGVEIEATVARAFPNNEILSGLAFICVSRTAPGTIQHTCFGRLCLGRFPQGNSPAATRLAAKFEAAATPCRVSSNIVTERWQKLVWNAPFNPISVLTGADTRTILENRASAILVERVMTEVCEIAAAIGHPLPEAVVRNNLEDTRRMAPYKTSMLLDFQAGRPMEVESILGNALAAARRVLVPTPYLEMLYALLTVADVNRGRG